MEYFNHIDHLQLNEETVITLGKFDGLHEGHRNLLETMFQLKMEKGYKALIFTFDMPPIAMISGERVPIITSNLEKRSLFSDIGVDYFVECPFSDAFRHMSAEEFIAFLVDKLCVKCFVVGTDFHFGYKRSGDYNTLYEFAEKYGYEVYVKEKVQYEGRDISSTFIREELIAGRMDTAFKLLGYPYFFENEIVHGNRIGTSMGIPTVNMEIPVEKVIPPKGVYVSEVLVDGKKYPAVSNVGNKPTIGENYPTGVETFLLDFSGDLYGKCIRVSLLYYIRGEIRFEGIEQLKAQIEQDIVFTKNYYKNVTEIC